MSARKFTAIEAARGIAALFVAAFHATVMVGLYYDGPRAFFGFFDFGHAGVQFFFVLTGFLVWTAHGKLMGQPDKLAVFVWRRIARIYPTYWAALALLLLTYFTFGRLGVPLTDLSGQNFGRILANIVTWPILPPYILDVAWTIPYEMLFYLLFAVVVWNKRVGLALMIAWMAVVAGANLVHEPSNSSFLFRILHLDFGIGVLAALWLDGGKRTVERPLVLLAVGIAFMLAAGLAADAGLVGHAWRPLKMSFAISSALIIVALVEAERQDRLTVPGWLVRLGGASYSVFLVHLIVLEPYLVLVERWGLVPVLPRDLVFVVGVAGGIGLGVVFHALVERPLTRLPTPGFLWPEKAR